MINQYINASRSAIKASSFFFLVFVCSITAPLWGDDASVLRKTTDSSWYDASEERYETSQSTLRKSVDVEDRHHSIYDPAQTPSQSTSQRSNSNTFFSNLWDALRSFVLFMHEWRLLLLILLLGLISFLIYKFIGPSEWSGGRRHKKQNANLGDRDSARVTDLPFDLAPSLDGLLAQSDAHRSRGDYSKALIYYFSHLLVELDDAGLIRLERGKTNYRYIRELTPYASLQPYLRTTVRSFEEVFFGKHPIDGPTFSRIRDQLPDFESHLKTEQNRARNPEHNHALS